MSLLTPELGLLFWMTLSFAIVFGILSKFGFPVITRMVDERHEYIHRSLEAADEANQRIETVRQESEALLNEAQVRRSEILQRAIADGNQIVREARERATAETEVQLAEARRQLEVQKQKAMNELRSQAAMLSVDIAEKILRRELSRPENRQDFCSKLLDEIEIESDSIGKN
jgi:F-type H+-transporting ATPase subunit b